MYITHEAFSAGLKSLYMPVHTAVLLFFKITNILDISTVVSTKSGHSIKFDAPYLKIETDPVPCKPAAFDLLYNNLVKNFPALATTIGLKNVTSFRKLVLAFGLTYSEKYRKFQDGFSVTVTIDNDCLEDKFECVHAVAFNQDFAVARLIAINELLKGDLQVFAEKFSSTLLRSEMSIDEVD
ncbi:hypothetical protein [Wuhan arthropod virus 1]|uniref:hypothetical protein n=1 Tax=Wuhan arthropod virus 1 TaxID=1923690 RepID=UPI00090A71E1|nr:hypothetical protein [Wuhan arthropod virus 1]APG77760.1 hypothetical protein [Wuhan arthropod virus 1]